MNRQFTKAYNVPFRALWVQSQDVIDVRMTVSSRPTGEKIFRVPATAHLHPSSDQLLGVLVADHKTLRIGRWLRQNWQEVALDPEGPIPAGTVLYDEGAPYAYFSLWPNLSGEEPKRAERRRAEVHIDENGDLKRIRLPVTIRRREDGLAIAAGYLPTR